MFSALSLQWVAAKSLRVGAMKSGAFFLNNSLFLLLLLLHLLLLLLLFCGPSVVTPLPTFFCFIRIAAVVLALTTVLPPGVSGSRHKILSSHVKYSEYEQQGERTTAKQPWLHPKPHTTVLNNATKSASRHGESRTPTSHTQPRCAGRYFRHLSSFKPNILDNLNPAACTDKIYNAL